MVMGDRRRGLQWLVAVGLVIDLALMGYLSYLLWGQSPVPSSAGAMTAARAGAPQRAPADMWGAYQAALAAAQAEAADALPVAAATQWEAATEEMLLSDTARWSFVFYSAAQSRSCDVVVGPAGGQVTHCATVWETPTPLKSGRWQAGAREPLLVFLAYGGRDFLAQHPGAVVDLHLGVNEEGRMVWSVVALDIADRRSFSTLLDAETMTDLLGGGVE